MSITARNVLLHHSRMQLTAGSINSKSSLTISANLPSSLCLEFIKETNTKKEIINL